MLVKNIIDYQSIDVMIENKLQNVGKIFALQIMLILMAKKFVVYGIMK